MLRYVIQYISNTNTNKLYLPFPGIKLFATVHCKRTEQMDSWRVSQWNKKSIVGKGVEDRGVKCPPDPRLGVFIEALAGMLWARI